MEGGVGNGRGEAIVSVFFVATVQKQQLGWFLALLLLPLTKVVHPFFSQGIAL